MGKGYEVYGTSRDHEAKRFDSLEKLGVLDKVQLYSLTPTDFRSVFSVFEQVQPDEIYLLSGQSSVGLSFAQPFVAFESNLIATLNVLEWMKITKTKACLFNASSTEIFGTTDDRAGVDTAFNPRSPYGMAKATSFWAIKNYREAYDLFTCSGILSNHESPLRPSRFVTRKIISSAVDISKDNKKKLMLGNMSIIRDWGWAPEFVEAMWLMLQQDEPQDRIIATGISNSLTEFTDAAFREVGLDWKDHVEIDLGLFRPTDLAKSVVDVSETASGIDWSAQVKMAEVVARMVRSENDGSLY